MTVRYKNPSGSCLNTLKLSEKYDNLHLFERKLSSGLYRAPRTMFHRFSILVSGKHTFTSFEMDRLASQRPTQARLGSVCFIPAGCECSYAIEGDDFLVFGIEIPITKMQKIVGDTLKTTSNSGQVLFGYFGPSNPKIRKISNLLYEEFHRANNCHELYLSSLTTALCVELVRGLNLDSGVNHTKHNRIADIDFELVLRLMNKAICGPLKIADIAKAFSMKPYTFSRAFRAKFQETPSQYIARERLEHAIHLLKNSEDSISQVAYRCGFSSQAHLTTRMQKYFSMTPAQVRNRHSTRM